MNPSTELLALLARLGLAAPAEVQAVARRAKRMAKGLPLFDCVWVDALAQAGTLTPYQAAEINAGRAERLALGPYVLCRPVTCTPYADVYHAVDRQSRREARVLVAWLAHVDRDSAEAKLQELLSAAPRLAEAGVDHIEAAAIEERDPHMRLWAAMPSIDGINVADWIVSQGRVSPSVVLEIARQMVADLRVLERFGLVHGDLAPASLLLGSEGRVYLPHPGVRPLVRPEEGYGRTELAPAAYETLAPERIVEGTPPDVQSELFACGCLWWHLLAGRSPIAGGDSLSKLNSARAARIPDVSRLAPETPPQLAAVIGRCVSADPARRGDSFAELQAQLGPSTRDGRQAIAECVRAHRNPPRSWSTGVRKPRRVRRLAAVAAVCAGCAMAMLAILYPLWSHSDKATARRPEASIVVARVAAKTSPMPNERSYGVNNVQFDPAINLASFQTDSDTPPEVRSGGEESATNTRNEDVLILDSARPVPAETLELRPGRIVRGREGTRPQISIHGAGLLLKVSNLRFENIDFLYEDDGHNTATKALILLEAPSVAFQGCSFVGNKGDEIARPVAILCQASSTHNSSAVPRNVVLDRCMLRQLSAAIEVRGSVVPSVEAHHTLLVDSSALLLTPVPSLKQPISLTLANVTVRHCDNVIALAYEQLPARPARIAVTATDCVFAQRQAIFHFLGAEPPQALLKMIQWTGEGSLLEEKGAVVAWQSQVSEADERIDDAEVAIDGLARSRLQFAGDKLSDAADSRLVQWAAPVGGIAPPGIDVSLLHLADAK